MKLFFNIPQRVKINTPFSNYSLEWAVYMKKEAEKKMSLFLKPKVQPKNTTCALPNGRKFIAGESISRLLTMKSIMS